MSGSSSTSPLESDQQRPPRPSGRCAHWESSSSAGKLYCQATGISWLDVVSVDPQPGRLSLIEAIALVTDVASRADRVAAGLRALREPEAAHMVDRLAQDADRAAAAFRALLATRPRSTDWYQVHRDMWIRYGDPG